MFGTLGSESWLYVLSRASWQAGVLVLLVAAINRLFRRQMTPSWRAVLWIVPLLRLVVLVVPPSSCSIFNLISSDGNEKSAFALHWNSPPDSTIRLDEVRPTVRTGQAESSQGAYLPETSTTSSGDASQLKSDPTNARQLKSVEPTTVIAAIWLVGFLGSILQWGISILGSSRLLRGAQLACNPDIARFLKRYRQELGIDRNVRCLITHSDIGPSVVGLMRPAIVLPARLFNEVSLEELEAILVHEMEHVRRWDALLLTLGRVASALHWFNPLVHYATRKLRFEVELAVDRSTIKILGNEARVMYGELLIKMSTRRITNLGWGQAANKRSLLRGRIDELTSPTQGGPLLTVLSALMVMTIFVVGLTDIAHTQEQTSGSQKPPAILGQGEENDNIQSSGQNPIDFNTVKLEDVLDKLLSREIEGTIRIRWSETHEVDAKRSAGTYALDPFGSGDIPHVSETDALKVFEDDGYFVVAKDQFVISTSVPAWTIERELRPQQSKSSKSDQDFRTYRESFGQGTISALTDRKNRYLSAVFQILAMNYCPRESDHYDRLLQSSVVRSQAEWAGRPALQLDRGGYSYFFDAENALLFLGFRWDHEKHKATCSVTYRQASDASWLVDLITYEGWHGKSSYEKFEYDLDYRPKENDFLERFPAGTLVLAADKYGRGKQHIALEDGTLTLLTDANREKLDHRVRRPQ